ncbi:S-type pyocin domain-containing protein [Pseudomonas gingeri]|uniref:S-type pyocin domain-containing protein n=1 Tax=Pseudomonas gingeri TaxID=117681 RepID=A0A7Y7XF77_9PSED|nr:colicin E3/pyocin S6 family cytotoxin [Pseudomonas gingeri]NWB98500.1 S-type pyocin domain-containing protein [Pseudomonas gingeri]
MGSQWDDDFFGRRDKKECALCRPGYPCFWCSKPDWRTESWGSFGGVEQRDPAPAPLQIPLQKEPWPQSKPPQSVIFAKSCEPGNWCRTEAGTATEPASHFGKVMVSKSKAIPAGAAALGATLGADAALGRIAGGGIIQEGFRWMLRSALVAGGGATVFIAGMLPARMGDGTLYSDDELRQMSAAASRVRFQFRHDAEGVLQLYGIHTAASGGDSVRVVTAQWRADGRTLEAHLDDGITLLWTPNGGPLLTPELTFPEHTDEPMGSIRVHPIEEGVDSQIDGYPAADDITLGDRIITFPINSGLRSIYVVFSKPLAGDHSYHQAPKGLVAFPDAVRDKVKGSVQGGGKKRTRWKDRKGRIYEWDSQHGAVEMYDKQGRHLGEYDPDTGEQTKPAKPGRKVEK